MTTCPLFYDAMIRSGQFAQLQPHPQAHTARQGYSQQQQQPKSSSRVTHHHFYGSTPQNARACDLSPPLSPISSAARYTAACNHVVSAPQPPSVDFNHLKNFHFIAPTAKLAQPAASFCSLAQTQTSRTRGVAVFFYSVTAWHCAFASFLNIDLHPHALGKI